MIQQTWLCDWYPHYNIEMHLLKFFFVVLYGEPGIFLCLQAHYYHPCRNYV